VLNRVDAVGEPALALEVFDVLDAARGEIVDDGDFGAPPKQRLRQMRPDEPCTTSDQRPHHTPSLRFASSVSYSASMSWTSRSFENCFRTAACPTAPIVARTAGRSTRYARPAASAASSSQPTRTPFANTSNPGGCAVASPNMRSPTP